MIYTVVFTSRPDSQRLDRPGIFILSPLTNHNLPASGFWKKSKITMNIPVADPNGLSKKDLPANWLTKL